ncbi:Leucine-rich_repeat domain superfamily [Hexamita inflata]|uniref:Leucine-rich repeat domain superfamily n=1 Tax=Hexamita inflata TaxID=28002 RepID=A0AA86NJQ9_9EUKA|nr:Leucine-rich repeat domain superfamily [Hexamita inflata]
MYQTLVIDLHPLQHLYKLQTNYAFGACIMDVSPLSNLTQLKTLSISNNKINNGDSLKHHKNFSEYRLSDQLSSNTIRALILQQNTLCSQSSQVNQKNLSLGQSLKVQRLIDLPEKIYQVKNKRADTGYEHED